MKKTVAADIFIKNNKSPSIFVSFFAPYLHYREVWDPSYPYFNHV